MPEVVVDNRASLIVADLVATIGAATVSGNPVFASVGTVNDVESFVNVADPIRADGRPACGIVEGTVEERAGNNSDEVGICHLPFEIVIRFRHIRKPGEMESVAMDRAKYLMEAAKSAVMRDRSRGGNAGLVQWQGDVINGTTVRGIARQLTARGKSNEAFYTASMSGACAWTRYRQPE